MLPYKSPLESSETMYYAFMYRHRLWKLQRDKERTRKTFGKLIAKAEAENKHQDEIAHLFSDELDSEDKTDDMIIETQMRFLTRQAEKYLVPTPKFRLDDGSWEQSKITGRLRWSQQTISSVTRALREEQKYRREYWQSWVALSIGVIGALTGLAFGLVALTK